ncbi:MAG: HEAT repeat domain-containing protein [Candidatus Omnitrophota bacterium]
MSHLLRIFRPHRTPPEDLEKIFVAREPILQEILERLERWETGKSRQHYLFIGPRGIGKTNLLQLIAHRIDTNPKLNPKWHTISFSEDAYGITRVTDLLIEGLRVISEKTNDKDITSTYDRVKYCDDDKKVADLSLDAFRRFHSQNNCGLLFMLENVKKIFDDQYRHKEEMHLLRKILIEEDWIVFVITSPTHLNAVTQPEEPLFEFFQVKFLEELTPEEQQEMLRKIALLENNTDFIENYLDKLKPKLRALYHFTGGNPRLTVMLYDLIANKHIVDVKSELDNLLDKLTPFYQDRMKEIGEQEARLLEKMALLEEGCTPTELAKELRNEQRNVSALLSRLERDGYVKREERRNKRTIYIIPERFFRIWHQMNHSRSARGRIQYLLEFFISWYATPEERDKVWNELADAFEIVLRDNEEDRIDELSEYMQYIEDISEGNEKYERLFDRLLKIENQKGFDAIKDELKNLDTQYQDDGYYFLCKSFFQIKRNYSDEALIAFYEAKRLIPGNTLALNNLARGLLFHLKKNNYKKEINGLIEYLEFRHEGATSEKTAMNLIRLLTDPNRYKRANAATDLGHIGSELAVGPLIACLTDEAPNVRGSAATALGRIGSELAVEPLITCLTDEAPNVRGSAATALGRIGSKLAVKPLIDCLKDEDFCNRGSAATALGRIGSELAVEPLIACLTDEAPNVRGSAATALGRIGSKLAVKPLIDCLKDEDNYVRASAATALGHIGSGLAVNPLITCLTDEEPNVRGSAATALGRIGSELAVEPLIDCLNDEDNYNRSSAATALGRIGSELAVEPLIDCLTDRMIDVRISAIIALGKIAEKKPFKNLELVIQSLIEIKTKKTSGLIKKTLEILLESTFRSGDIETVTASIEGIKDIENGYYIFKPYYIALEFIQSKRDPSVLERQQPEMRDAVQLLVDAFDNGFSSSEIDNS